MDPQDTGKCKAGSPKPSHLFNQELNWRSGVGTEDCTLPSLQNGIWGSLWGIPVSQHVVPDLLHQLEGPGQR